MKKKLERNSGRRLKGQFNIEFFTVLILFVGFAAYFSMRLAEVRPIYIKAVRQAIIRSEVYRISEVLINNPGHPTDWDTLVGTPGESEIKRIGLLDHSQNKTNLLSEQKIIGLNTLCSSEDGYDKIKDLIGAEHDFSIILIEKPSELVKIDCGSTQSGENVASIRRLGVFDSDGDGELEYGELIVQAW